MESLATELDELCQSANVKRTTAQAVVKKLVASGCLLKIGNGRKGSPYRYYSQPKNSFCQTPTL